MPTTTATVGAGTEDGVDEVVAEVEEGLPPLEQPDSQPREGLPLESLPPAPVPTRQAPKTTASDRSNLVEQERQQHVNMRVESVLARPAGAVFCSGEPSASSSVEPASDVCAVVVCRPTDTGSLGIQFQQVSISSVQDDGLGQYRCNQILRPDMKLVSINGVPADRLAYNA